jgi:5-methylthioribose kinase
MKQYIIPGDDRLTRTKFQFVMGDFWPGNLVLSFDRAGNVIQIRVLDWEMCKPGLFGAELGQFCAELVLLTKFNADICGHTASVILEDLLKTYATHITPDLELCRRAIVHLGAHLVTLTPRIEWGGKETTQEVVKEGKRLVLEGYSAEKGWLLESAIKPLAAKVE